jgi:hypothetical protein
MTERLPAGAGEAHSITAEPERLRRVNPVEDPMLSFQPKKPSKGVGFTLDPVKREQAKAPLARRRYMHLLFLAGIAGVTGFLLWSFLDKISSSLDPATKQLKQEISLAPMAKPTIADLPVLPDAAAISEHRAVVADQVTNGTVPLWIDQPDASTMAWLATTLERDRSAPPLPQRVDARDLMLRHVKVGENVVISGQLEDSQPAPIAGSSTGYQRLLVSLPDQQYLEVLAPENTRDLLIGDAVLVVGRFIGFAVLPPADPGASAPIPVVGSGQPEAAPAAGIPSPAATPAAPTRVEVPLIAARSAAKPAAQLERENPYVMRGEWRLPEDIYRNIDDDLLLVETRPYYYTLGQVLLDRTTPEVFAKAKNANENASALHKEPSAFRGQPFTIRGHVFHSWEDTAVAQDQPFGVSRVVRIIMWTEDWGDWEVNDGGKVKTSRKLILRAFELAAISHDPLPLVGEVITANGRFLRLRSMEVTPNEARDRRLGIKRQSDRANTFLFVTDGFTVLPNAPKYDFTILGILVVVLAGFLGGTLLWVARREAQKKEMVFDSVRKLRQSRHALKAKQQGESAEIANSVTPGADASPSEPPKDA